MKRQWSVVHRVTARATWAYLVWVVLTWTLTLEQLLFGAVFALLIGIALAPLGEAAGPWSLLRPRLLVGALRLGIKGGASIVAANVSLSRRIWAPSRPLRSGMVIVATEARSDAGLAAVGLVTSLIVDNQLVDIDRRNNLLQYHAVDVPQRGPKAARRAINGPVEDLLAPFEGRHA